MKPLFKPIREIKKVVLNEAWSSVRGSFYMEIGKVPKIVVVKEGWSLIRVVFHGKIYCDYKKVDPMQSEITMLKIIKMKTAWKWRTCPSMILLQIN